MRGSRGGGGGPGGPDPPPGNLQSLISPILLEMKKISYFSYLCIGPTLEKISGSAPVRYRYESGAKRGAYDVSPK